jgi:hypothetical protein
MRLEDFPDGTTLIATPAKPSYFRKHRSSRRAFADAVTHVTHVLLADTWFISPSPSSYLELGSSAREMVLPGPCENYPVLGTRFLPL